MPLITNFRYRPEIDGLRAIAVLAVVLYHAGLGVSGGYIGVDVFFVVSGFLITSLILKDLQEGKFTLAHFWERRARRIIPAAVVIILATLIAGWFLLLPSDYAKLGQSAAWQAVFGANIHFWLNTDYFAGPAEEQPLLHTWSLAVEEQFYLFFPLILFSLFRFRLFRCRSPLLVLFSGGFLASLAVSIYAVPRMPAAAFYLLPTRAWELLCGAIVAILPAAALRRSWREALTWVALAAILAPCFLYTKETPFPGLAALPPCLGTALFIWASGSGSPLIQNSKFKIQNFLSSRPVVFIGLISYSFYLWHWPVLAFHNYWAFSPSSVFGRLGLVGASGMLAAVSWRFVEMPFRRRAVGSTRMRMFGWGFAGIVAVLLAGGLIAGQKGLRGRFPAPVVAAADARNDFGFHHEMNACDIEADRLVPIGVSEGQGRLWGLVWGDSFAMAAMPAFDEYMKGRGVAGRQVTHSATAPLLGYCRTRYGLREAAIPFGEAVLEYVRRRQVQNVFLVACWRAYSGPEGYGNKQVNTALLETVRRFREAGAVPWIVLSVPNHPVDVPRLLAQARLARFDYAPYTSRPEDSPADGAVCAAALKEAALAGARIIDPRGAFVDPSDGRYIVEKEGVPLYIDKGHLTKQGARMMLVPTLERAIGSHDSR